MTPTNECKVYIPPECVPICIQFSHWSRPQIPAIHVLLHVGVLESSQTQGKSQSLHNMGKVMQTNPM